MKKNAKVVINELYQQFVKHGAQPVDYSYSELPCTGAGKVFECRLKLSGISVSDDLRFDDQTFTATGSRKKDAQDAAAIKAFAWLQQNNVLDKDGSLVNDLFSPSAQQLSHVIKKLFSSQSCVWREQELHGQILVSQTFDDGWLNVTLLTRTRAVDKWLKTAFGMQAVADMPAAADKVVSTLKTEQDKIGDCVEIDDTLLRIRAPFRMEYRNLEELDVPQRQVTAVLLPAASHCPPREVVITVGNGSLWREFGGVLGCKPERVMAWGKLGKRALRVMQDGNRGAVQQQDTDDTQEFQGLRSPCDPPSSSAAAAASDGEFPFASLDRPFVYCTYATGLPYNARASWLAGKSIHGDVLLSGVYVHQVISHGPLLINNYSAAHFLRHVGAMWPQVDYITSMSDSLLVQLPTTFRSNRLWFGRLPKDLLGHYAEWHLNNTPQPEYSYKTIKSNDGNADGDANKVPACESCPVAMPADERGDNDDDAKGVQQGEGVAVQQQQEGEAESVLYICTARLPAIGGGKIIEATSHQYSNREQASQHAALLLLHAIQEHMAREFHVDSVRGTSDALGPPTPPARVTDDQCSGAIPTDVHAIKEGTVGGKTVETGMVVQVSYTISVAVQNGDGVGGSCDVRQSSGMVVETNHCLKFMCGGGGILGGVEGVLVGRHVGAQLSMRLPLVIEGSDPLHTLQHTQCQLTVHITDLSRPGESGNTTEKQKLFDPPLSVQRYDFVCEVMQRCGARCLLDVGCGDGKLIHNLTTGCAQGKVALECISGMDISTSALKAGAVRLRDLCRKLPGSCRDGGVVLPRLSLFHGDIAAPAARIAGCWGSVGGVDVVTLIEVVEHLDPVPLSAIGPAVFGSLHPATVIISTPNVEYNTILEYLGGGLMANRMRNDDHRFEWTRAEFQDWCSALASQYGYSVKYSGLGRAVEEDRALSAPDCSCSTYAGEATQVAVFSRLAVPPVLLTPIWRSTASATNEEEEGPVDNEGTTKQNKLVARRAGGSEAEEKGTLPGQENGKKARIS